MLTIVQGFLIKIHSAHDLIVITSFTKGVPSKRYMDNIDLAGLLHNLTVHFSKRFRDA
jgi:hypothetical protein